MAETFYPFVENEGDGQSNTDLAQPLTSARIAVYDDMAMVPRVVNIEPTDIRTFLEEITQNVFELAKQQGTVWSFMLIRELVENFIHAAFTEVSISILDKGRTLVFSDQGPGIPNKQAALRPSFSSATRAMKRYIRGVGSGLPIVEEQLRLHGGTLTIEDNLGRGTIVRVELPPEDGERPAERPAVATVVQPGSLVTGPASRVPADPYARMWPAAYPQNGISQAQAAGTYYGYPLPYPGMPYGYSPYGAAAQGMPYPSTWPFQENAPQQPTMGETQVGEGAQRAEESGLPSGMREAAIRAHAPLNEEQRGIVLLFSAHPSVGPAELSAATGMSSATGSRRLRDLAKAGYIVKHGQKYVLTGEGELMLDLLMNGEA